MPPYSNSLEARIEGPENPGFAIPMNSQCKASTVRLDLADLGGRRSISRRITLCEGLKRSNSVSTRRLGLSECAQYVRPWMIEDRAVLLLKAERSQRFLRPARQYRAFSRACGRAKERRLARAIRNCRVLWRRSGERLCRDSAIPQSKMRTFRSLEATTGREQTNDHQGGRCQCSAAHGGFSFGGGHG